MRIVQPPPAGLDLIDVPTPALAATSAAVGARPSSTNRWYVRFRSSRSAGSIAYAPAGGLGVKLRRPGNWRQILPSRMTKTSMTWAMPPAVSTVASKKTESLPSVYLSVERSLM